MPTLKPGIYLVEIKKEGFERFEKRIELNNGMREILTAALVPFTGGLSVTKNPPSAIIRLDGEVISDTHSPSRTPNESQRHTYT